MDRMFEVSLARFVAERKKLAKELRAAGQRAAAKQVAELPKPSPPAWALNQVARRAPELVAAYVATLDALVDVHRAVSGRDALFAASAAEREAKRRVVDAAVRALSDDGGRISKTTQDGLGELLQEAATDRDARGRLLAGTLLGGASTDAFASLVALVEPESAAEPPAIEASVAATPSANDPRRPVSPGDGAQTTRGRQPAGRAAEDASERLREETRRREEAERLREETRRREEAERLREEEIRRTARRAALTRELVELERAHERAVAAEREAELELEAARLRVELAKVRCAAAASASRALREELERT